MISTLRPEHVGKILLEGAGVGILVGRAGSALGAASPPLPSLCTKRLDGAHVEVLRDDALRERFGILATDQSARVAGGQLASATSARTAAGSFRRRRVLARWLRLLPITSANCSWV